MKNLFKAMSLVAIVVLAACGSGGSGSPVGGIPATPAPVVPVYQSQIVFTGALAGKQSGVSTLGVALAAPQTSLNKRSPFAAPGATPVPIMILSPNGPNDSFMGSTDNAVGGIVSVVVSPEPQTPVSIAMSFSGVQPSVVPTNSPAPTYTNPPGVVGVIGVAGSAAAVGTQAAGVATATVSAPVNQAPQTPIYEYQSIGLDCANIYPNDFGGASWNGTTWVGASSPATADIYMTDTSPQCNAPWATASQPTLNVPYGGVLFNNSTPCSSFTASQWSNTFTSIPMATVGTILPDYSMNAVLLFKTASGAIAKICPTATGNIQNPIYGGAIEVSGDSIDGF